MKPIPASSKTDPPLARAEPISEGGAASDSSFKRRKKLLHNSSHREEWQHMMRERALQAVSAEGGAGGGPGAREEVSLQGKSVRSPPWEEEAVAEMDAEQTETPFHVPLCHSGNRV